MNNWVKVAPLQDIQKLGARVVRTHNSEGEALEIGVFRLEDDSIFAINNRCPHKGGPLSEGLVYGDKIACPMHSWKISLVNGKADEPDEGQVACYQTKLDAGMVYIKLKEKQA